MKTRAYKDQLPGGAGDDKTPEDFDPNALEKGIKHELEHTSDPDLATEIAIDHLTEDPHYYDKAISKKPVDKRVYIEGDDLVKIVSTLSEVGNVLYDRGDHDLSKETAQFVAALLTGR